MTLKEAIGVKNANIDVKTGRKLEHSEIYGRAIDLLGGVDAVWQYVPFSLEEIKAALPKDKHLNNLSMREWDMASGFICRGADCRPVGGGIWALYRKAGINCASNSDGVCILKECARLMAERS